MIRRIRHDIDVHEPSEELAAQGSCAIDAAIDIGNTLQGQDGLLTEVAKLAQILDTEGARESNAPFFQKVLERTGHSGLSTTSDVQAAMRDVVRTLRTIEVFRTGDLEQMKRFCLELDDAITAASGQRHREHHHAT